MIASLAFMKTRNSTAFCFFTFNCPLNNVTKEHQFMKKEHCFHVRSRDNEIRAVFSPELCNRRVHTY